MISSNRLYLLAFLSLACCRESSGQRQGLPSPSGVYVLSVPVERDAERRQVWRLTIADREGKVLFKDPYSGPAALNVYWTWDADERAWLYSSDSGRVFFYERTRDGWQESEWLEGSSLALPALLADKKR